MPPSVMKSHRKKLLSDGFTGRDLEDEMARFHWQTNPMKELVLMNCWSISPHESYALWKIYLGDSKNGVAIKSAVGTLKSVLQKSNDSYPEEFYVGKVRYRSHLRSDDLSRFSIVTTKKPYYEFEKELRLFILNYPMSEGGTRPPYDLKLGRTVDIDLRSMIREIYVSPFAEGGYMSNLKNLLSRNKLPHKLIKQSDIRDI